MRWSRNWVLCLIRMALACCSRLKGGAIAAAASCDECDVGAWLDERWELGGMSEMELGGSWFMVRGTHEYCIIICCGI